MKNKFFEEVKNAIKLYFDPISRVKKTCTCDLKLDECKSPLYIGSCSVSRKPSELFKCGKVKKLLEKL